MPRMPWTRRDPRDIHPNFARVLAGQVGAGLMPEHRFFPDGPGGQFDAMAEERRAMDAERDRAQGALSAIGLMLLQATGNDEQVEAVLAIAMNGSVSTVLAT